MPKVPLRADRGSSPEKPFTVRADTPGSRDNPHKVRGLDKLPSRDIIGSLLCVPGFSPAAPLEYGNVAQMVEQRTFNP